MTSDDFAKKWRLLKRVTRNGVQSFNAQEMRTGRVVMAHCLVGGTTATYDLLARVACLPAADRARVIESTDVDGTSWVVTEVLPGFSSFESWLDERVAPGAPTPPAQPAPLPQPDRTSAPGATGTPPADAPGEFTRFFKPASAQSTAAPATTGRGAPSAPAAGDHLRSGAPPKEPGEFTRMFGPGPSAAEPTDPPPAGPPPGAPRVSDGADERTPGDFTSFFQPLPPDAVADGSLHPPARPPASALPAIDWSAPDPRAGQDGRNSPMLPEPAALHVPPMQAAPPAQPGTPGLGTAVFGLPQVPASVDSPLPVGTGSPSPYTQVIAGRPPAGPSRPEQSAGGTALPLQPAQPALAGRRSLVPLVVALNAVALAAIALVLYFILRP